MQIDVIEKEGLKREITIEVPAEVVKTAYNKIYDEFRKEAKIKGFRPGKVPATVIRSKFKSEATAEVIDKLVQEYYEEAIKEKKLEPVGSPVLSKVDVDEGKPMVFTVGIEIMPHIEKVEYEAMTIDTPQAEVPDEDVDKVVEYIRKSSAEIRTVERAAGPDDILIGDIEAIAGDLHLFDQTKLENKDIDLGDEQTDKAFRDGLIGASRNETREITVNYPQDYGNERFAGKTLTYKIVVKEIKERILPPLNDDFAKTTGQAETLLELRLNIRKQLEAEKQADITRANKQKLINQITEKNPIDVPETMLESYLANVIKDYKDQGEEADETELREKYRPVGIRTIRWFLLFHRLAVEQKIEVTSEDVENWIKRFANSYRMDVPKAKEILAKTGKAGDIRDSILEEKVLEYLMDKAEKVKPE